MLGPLLAPGLARPAIGSEARFDAWTQLPTTVEAGLPVAWHAATNSRPGIEIAGRRIPPLVLFDELASAALQDRAVPLPEANTLAHLNYEQNRLGRVRPGHGEILRFNPETLLVKFQGHPLVAALRVEAGRELAAARMLAARSDVELIEFDVLHHRAFMPNDPLMTNQWHHQVLGSFNAWDISRGAGFVRIAIVDTPFQMDHPDLAAHVVPGWDAVANQPVNASAGIDHSTLGAGLAAAVIDNGLGVAGAGNCELLPININGFTSEMCNAVYWAASNGVRVVNISWDGADSDALNAAGAYLRANGSGILAMAGLNGSGFVDYTNQPDIWCIAMTDAADNQRSAYGNHIDFAAPGWNVFSTTTNSGYSFCSGTSYATPLFCGIVAVLWSINPTLEPDEVVGILKATAVDLGQPGWDMFFGWGRINFAAAAAATAATLPVVSVSAAGYGAIEVTTAFHPGLTYTLWRSPTVQPAQWSPVPSPTVRTNSGWLMLGDSDPPARAQFYRLSVARP